MKRNVLLVAVLAVTVVAVFIGVYNEDSDAMSSGVSVATSDESETSETFIKMDGVTLSLFNTNLDSRLIDSLSIKKVDSNELTEYYNSTGKDLGAGPSLGWSLEIESIDKIDTPLSLKVDLSKEFIEQLGNKYEPVMLYYFLADLPHESIEYAEPLSYSLDNKKLSIQANIEPSLFRKMVDNKKYLLLLIVGSVPKKE